MSFIIFNKLYIDILYINWINIDFSFVSFICLYHQCIIRISFHNISVDENNRFFFFLQLINIQTDILIIFFKTFVL